MLGLSGCAGGLTGLGAASRYSCPGMPSQPLCQSVVAIYALTDGAGPPPATERRPRLIRHEYPFPAGSGWVWSELLWQ
ncbi:MAG: conjugal transfer protein TraV [Chromatiaceae bacterium]|nr:MAG: conjugal transfer protein TraV [Chromatiaceae bacterium]